MRSDEEVLVIEPELEALLTSLPSLPPEEKARVLQKLTNRVQIGEKEQARNKFMHFVDKVWPDFIGGRHHKKMAAAFEKVANGECKRLIINMPPRHTKSEFASYLLPAWFLGKFPNKKVIQCSNTAELAVGFGRKVRNLVDSEVYKDIFPNLELRADSKAAGRWNTSRNGDYFAIGVGGTVTGKGADILIIDDPHSEQEAAMAASNPDVFDKVYEWYTSGPRQRLQPGGAIVIVMTRWAQRDLTGQVMKAAAARGGEQWDVIEFPAIMPSGNPLWPEFWSAEELTALREELPNSKWQAQYQQNPVGNESAIVKRDWWRWWEQDGPPECEYILQTWDTAFEKNNRADYSAGTTWGVFTDESDMSKNIILLNTYKKRVEWVELKRDVLNEYREYEPDGLLIEKKATGAPLIYELRAMGIPVMEYTPSKGQDKIARLNSVSDIIASGKVWVPRTRWAEELVDEIAAFPSGEHDDLVDATTLALMRFRQGGFLRLPIDEPEEQQWFKSSRKAAYY
jgi:predicted phage terminase large subunit-like protein